MEWWKKQQLVVQTNLQVKDTSKINPEELAAQMKDLGVETLVFNVGGIYAWYESKVPFHHVNEYLPSNRDLLAEMLAACHKNGIRFVGRFDFSKAEDLACQSHPEWFALSSEGKPQIVGANRPGQWSLLYNTCINSPYLGNAVAQPVLIEALSRYPMDGLFFNSPLGSQCYCDLCKEKYKRLYDRRLPDDPALIEPSWRTRQVEDNMIGFREAIDKVRPGLPIILYHWQEQGDYLNAKISEAVCDESQNNLSRGTQNLADDWTPSMKIKLLRLDTDAPPFEIVHSSPGMDWRHTGISPAEFQFWLSQVPAAGGSLWHSLTGIPDTITDKRLLQCVKKVNGDFHNMIPSMEGASPVEDILLLYNYKLPPKGWERVLFTRQIQFGIAFERHAAEMIKGCKAVLLPDGFPVSNQLAFALKEYVNCGGILLLEGNHPGLHDIQGVSPMQKKGEYMLSSYLRREPCWKAVNQELNAAELLPFRGHVNRLHPTGARTMATLVPSFAPMEAVGAPPERATILSAHTDIPLCMFNDYGKGKVISLSFSLNHLLEQFALHEHLLLADELFSLMIPQRSITFSTNYPGVTAGLFKRKNGFALQLVNGTGKRPLNVCVPLYNLGVSLFMPESKPIALVKVMQNNEALPFLQSEGSISFTIKELEVWSTVDIQFI